jgi:hypothetical protein
MTIESDLAKLIVSTRDMVIADRREDRRKMTLFARRAQGIQEKLLAEYELDGPYAVVDGITAGNILANMEEPPFFST